MPYLKVGLFRVNHYGLDLGRVLAELQARSAYDLGLVAGHVARCG